MTSITDLHGTSVKANESILLYYYLLKFVFSLGTHGFSLLPLFSSRVSSRILYTFGCHVALGAI